MRLAVDGDRVYAGTSKGLFVNTISSNTVERLPDDPGRLARLVDELLKRVEP